MYTIWLSRNDYEKRCCKVCSRYKGLPNRLTSSINQLLVAISAKKTEWSSTTFTGSYSDVKESSSKFQSYKQTVKRNWVTEKQDLITLYGNVQTKLKTYRLRPWEPVPELRPEVFGFSVAEQDLLKPYFRVLIEIGRDFWKLK